LLNFPLAHFRNELHVLQASSGMQLYAGAHIGAGSALLSLNKQSHHQNFLDLGTDNEASAHCSCTLQGPHELWV
jgi:hypothetical protein